MVRTAVALSSIVALLLGIGCRRAPEKPARSEAPSPAFAAFVDDYFSARYDWSPTEGTSQGFHQYDTKLDDLSAAAHTKRIDVLKSLLVRLDALRTPALSGNDDIDARILDDEIRSELLELETLQTWKKNPMGYVGLPGSAIDLLMKRDFAPAHDRLQSVVARLKAIPAGLEAMRANVENPPKEFTDLSIRMAGGSVGFFRRTVANWAKTAAGPDAALWKEFEASNAAAAKAIEGAARWLKQDLLPRSKGSYAIGAENFANKLRYEEMVDLPLDRVDRKSV